MSLAQRFRHLRTPELWILAALAALTRCWDLFRPHRVIFDERLFEVYAGSYFTGRFYFDVHPPLGKLLIAAAAKLLGVSGSTLVHAEPAVALRILPALAGAMLVPLTWSMLRQLGAGRTVATLAASLVLLDNALLVQSRFILLDSLLMAFSLGAITLFLAARPRAGAARVVLLAACGMCAGASTSIKWTGLAALGLVVLALVAEGIHERRALRRAALDTLVVVLPALGVYVASFAIHFALLRTSGSGDAWMPAAFQATLRGNPRFDSSARYSLVASAIALNRSMALAQRSIPPAHLAFASRWYTWPFMFRPLHYWHSPPLANGRVANVHLFGNPVVWYGAIVGTIATLATWMRSAEGFRGRRWALAFLGAGLAINYAPFAFVRRELFLYSYLPALLLAIALASYGAGVMFHWTDDTERPFAFPSRRSAAMYWCILGAAFIGFLVVAPISYGWPESMDSIYSFAIYN